MPQENRKEIEYRTLKLTMQLDKYLIIKSAIKRMQTECPTMNEARCLELICIDYINGLKTEWELKNKTA
jgi:hypothetical protein